MEEMMLKLIEFSHNHHPYWVKMLAKNIRRGIRVLRINRTFWQVGNGGGQKVRLGLVE